MRWNAASGVREEILGIAPGGINSSGMVAGTDSIPHNVPVVVPEAIASCAFPRTTA